MRAAGARPAPPGHRHAGAGSYHAECLAYVDVTCLAQRDAGARRNSRRRARAVGQHHRPGLLMTDAAVDLPTLGEYLVERLDRCPASPARAPDCHRLYAEGSFAPRSSPRPQVAPLPRPRRHLGAVDRGAHVRAGGRRWTSYATLAKVTGISQPTARRRVEPPDRSGAILLRTEVADAARRLAVSWVLVDGARLLAGPTNIATTLARLRKTARLRAPRQHAVACSWSPGYPSLEEVVTVRRGPGEVPTSRCSTSWLVAGVRSKSHRPPARRRRRAVDMVRMDVWQTVDADDRTSGQHTQARLRRRRQRHATTRTTTIDARHTTAPVDVDACR